jgi:hypothetical protein
MAHFAQLDEDNNVLSVVVISNGDINNLPFPQSDPVGIAFCQSLYGADTLWRQTSYNGNFRRQYAGVGGFYYPPIDVFVGPSPFPSWTFRATDATWQPPVQMPTVPPNYIAVWNEDYLEWDIVFDRGSPI